MASQEIVPGYRMRRSALVPVQAGDLTVQLVAEYEGLDVVGRVVRIENSSPAPVGITEGRVALVAAIAVAVARKSVGVGTRWAGRCNTGGRRDHKKKSSSITMC